MNRHKTSLKSLVLVAWVAAVGLLTGCATVSTVESDVQSFSTTATPVQAGTFRFERLPSQDQNAEQATSLESMAQAALLKAGFTRMESGARYSVQIGRPSPTRFLAGRRCRSLDTTACGPPAVSMGSPGRTVKAL